MTPVKQSVLAIILIGGFFTLLLSINELTAPETPENDPGMARQKSQELSEQLDREISILQESLKSLSYNTYWQSSPVAEWSFWLKAQQPLYQAAGISLLGVHSLSNKVLSFEKPGRPDYLGELKKPIERMYETKDNISFLQEFREIPAVIILSPIKNIENEIIGALIGVKFFDAALLRQYHHTSQLAAVTTKNDVISTISVETSPDLNDFTLVNVAWPANIQSSIWKLSLLVKPKGWLNLGLLYLLLGTGLTVALAVIVVKQFNKAQSELKRLNESINIELPLIEQLDSFKQLQNSCQEPGTIKLLYSFQARLEQIMKQKKSLSHEIKELQHRETELTNTISNLNSERDSAIAAPNMKSMFLSRMGDEITTPMKSVVSMLKLLSSYPLEDEAVQLLNIAKRSTRTLVDNLNNILDFSKLDAQMLKLSPMKFCVRELVDDMASELSLFANDKGLSLQACTDPEIPREVTADLNRVKQILRNLVGNAVRFTKEGEVSLFTNAYVDNSTGNKMLKFTVADTGVGIPKDAQKDLFDSLETSTRLNNASFAGRLRLIVSKNLAELMGGEIGVESKFGQGSTFWFTITYE